MDHVVTQQAHLDDEQQPITQQSSSSQSNWKGWVVCMVASLFFFYDFIQMNIFSVINVPLMHDFHLNAAQLGTLSAYFFMSNALFLIPVGTILDRISTKKTILYTLLIGIVSMLCLSFVHTLGMAKLFRFTSGITSAFCFLSCVRLASRWFPPQRFALVMGFIVTMAMIGGVVAQTPAALLVQHFGWRGTLQIDALFGFVIWGLCCVFVQDFPQGKKQVFQAAEQQLAQHSYWRITLRTIFRFQVWVGACYTCLMNLPICVLGGIWGTLYLRYVHHLPMIQASEIIALLFFGTIVGSPACGWLSDRVGRRRWPMLVGALLSIISFSPLVMHLQLGFSQLALIFFLVGFFTSTQILSYPYVSEINHISVTATAVSVVSFVTIGSLSFFQPLFGWLVDKHAATHAQHAALSYQASDYMAAMWMFPVALVVAWLIACLSKESYCRRKQDQAL